MFIKINLV